MLSPSTPTCWGVPLSITQFANWRWMLQLLWQLPHLLRDPLHQPLAQGAKPAE